MPKKRDIVKEFKEYYDGLSDDAKLIIHSILLVPKKANPKSQPSAPSAGKRSSSSKQSKGAGGANSGEQMESAGAAQAASSGGLV